MSDKPHTTPRMGDGTPNGVHLWLLLWKATKTQEARARRSIDAMGICLTDFGALEALLHKGPLPVNTIRKKVLISSGSMTAAVDRLERQGLVERKASATDRRERITHLTAKGTDVIKRLFAEHVRDMEEAFAHLDRAERESLARSLSKLAERGQFTAAAHNHTGGNQP